MRANRYTWIALVILLVAFGLRARALDQAGRFHPDEALFATFARQAAINGDWLLLGNLDKPPLAIYAGALSMAVAGSQPVEGVLQLDPLTGEFAARLPGLFASLILVAVAYGTARRLYPRDPLVAVWAMLFVALSPYALAFSATAFTDGLMIALAGLAVYAAAGGSWTWAGVWLALAFWTKTQAIYALPLVLLVGWSAETLSRRAWIALLTPPLIGAGLLLAWDAARGWSSSIFALAAVNNPITGIVASDAVLPRLSAWFGFARWLLGTPTILLLGVGVIDGLVGAFRRRDRAATIDAALIAYIIGFLLLHWLIDFNIYDRYLLPLLLPSALIGARGGIAAWRWVRRRLGSAESGLLVAAMVFTLVGGAWSVASGAAPIGGDAGNGVYGRYDGIIPLADALNETHVAAVIYDHWLGWELDYYLGTWHDKRRVYYPTPEALAADALLLDETDPRYFVAPLDAPFEAWLDALRAVGFTDERVYRREGFVIYELTPP